jgi:carbon monoxide dehydrogenase subunit G
LIRLSVRFPASPERLWEELADLASHAEWMADADAISFIGDQTTGVGTQMRVPTRIGPLRTNDLMTVTGWEEGRMIEVNHVGAVSGTGRFEVVGVEGGSQLEWSESLRFPWWLGGPVGAWLARPILKWVWRANLKRLGERL